MEVANKNKIRAVLTETTETIDNDYIIDSLLEKINTESKINEIYTERLNELIEEKKANNKLEDYIKALESESKLQEI